MVWWEGLLVCYIITIIITHIAFLFRLMDDEFILSRTPAELYEDTNMNWFGCIVCWIGEFVLMPGIWITVLVAMFFEWLFTVGRKLK